MDVEGRFMRAIKVAELERMCLSMLQGRLMKSER